MKKIGNQIKRKLKSNKGTSIFFGLLLFLVASILSAVMLNASVTTVKRVESDRKIEQNYLTCSSAAKMLRDAVVNTTVTSHEVVVVSTNATEGSSSTKDWKSEMKNVTSNISEFHNFLRKYVQSFADRVAATPEDTLERTYEITVPTNATDTEAGLAPVTAQCTIQNAKSGDGFDIIMKLKTGDSADDCQMVLYLTGKGDRKMNTTTDGETGKTTTTTTDNTYTWTATDFIYGDEPRTSEAQQ